MAKKFTELTAETIPAAANGLIRLAIGQLDATN